MKIIDLTHTFTDDMPVYPGDPKSSLKQTAFIEKDTYNDSLLTSLMHVGTHMDAPFHMVAKGRKMDQIEPEKFFGRGVLIDARGKQKIDASLLMGALIKSGDIVLVFTDFAQKYRTGEYYKNLPYLTEDFAQKMVELGVKIVGMDMLGPDLDQPWPVHKILLGSEILIIENMANLDQLLDVTDFEVIALPAKINTDAAFVRVVAKIP